MVTATIGSRNRLAKAQRWKDEEADTIILVILKREKDRAFWRRLNYVMAKSRGRSVKVIQVDHDGGIVTNAEGQ